MIQQAEAEWRPCHLACLCLSIDGACPTPDLLKKGLRALIQVDLSFYRQERMGDAH